MTALPEAVATLPCWQGTPRGEALAGGLSNAIWKVTDDAGAHVLRLGPDYPCHHVLRAREAAYARAAQAAGFAPAVEYAAPGVMVTAFIEARTWGPEDVRADPGRVADLLRRFHHAMAALAEGPPYLFSPFLVARDYARSLHRADSPFLPHLDRLLPLADRLEAAQVPLPLVFGHNDLLPANLLDDGRRLWLIDYEYAGFASPLFDLAGLASNAGMTGEETDALLAAYFGAPPDAALLRAFDAMQCASLLREAMWAMVSFHHLAAPGVDYAAYADENLGRLDAALARFTAAHGSLP